MRVLFALALLLHLTLAASDDNNEPKVPQSSSSSIFVDDVVVVSILGVRRKPGTRQGRTGTGVSLETASRQTAPQEIDGSTVLKLERPKRQLKQGRRRNPYTQNGQAPQQYGGGFPQQYGNSFPGFQPITGSASNAQAQAQAFQANSPFGNFGAAASNAGSQGFSFGQDGIRGNAGLSGSQSYNLPNGNTLAISYANGFSFGPDGKPTITKGNSIAYTGSDGKPIPGFAPNVY